MDPLAAHILTLCNQAPTEAELTAPRRYRRRETWIPVEGENVTVWRMTSHDPDIDEAFPSVFLYETAEHFIALIDGDESPTAFSKRNFHGAIEWRMDSRGSNNQQLTESGVTS